MRATASVARDERPWCELLRERRAIHGPALTGFGDLYARVRPRDQATVVDRTDRAVRVAPDNCGAG